MGARPSACRLTLCIATTLAAITLIACGPPTPEELYDEAAVAIERQDGVEAEILLEQVLNAEDLDPELEIIAHLTRAQNHFMNFGDLESARAEYEAVIELTSVDSDEGLIAVTSLADMNLRTEGAEAFHTVLDDALEQLAPLSSRATSLYFHRFNRMAAVGASNELIRLYPSLIAQIASSEGLQTSQRRDISLEATQVRTQIADLTDDHQGAIDAFELFISGYPDSDPARFMVFEIASRLQQLGNPEGARERAAEGFAIYEEGLAASESSQEEATYHLMIAEAHLMLEDLAAASPEFAMIFDGYPGFQHRSRAMARWAEALAEDGNIAESRGVATRLAVDYPNTQWHALADQFFLNLDLMEASPEIYAMVTGMEPPEGMFDEEPEPVIETQPASPEAAS